MASTQLTAGSLFSGIGGFELGFSRAGIETLWSVEINDYCQQVLQKNFPHTEKFKDVRTVGKHNLRSVDIICGGFPCQDLSVAGKQIGLSGERSGLWFEMLRVISELRPTWVLVENVPNLRTKGADIVIAGLEGEGYSVLDPQVVGAWAIGANHKRDRVWIMAYTQGEQNRRIQFPGVSSDTSPTSHVVHASSKRLSQPESQPRIEESIDSTTAIGTCAPGTGWWAVEPNVGRVASGISRRVDRLRGLGNAVVPQLPELFGRFIIALTQ